jgi:hypothetical protein
VTAIRQLVCDYCRHEDSALEPASPEGWWEVPGRGANGTAGHCCPTCFAYDTAAQAEVIASRADGTRAVIQANPPHEREERRVTAWPARRPPFGDADA